MVKYYKIKPLEHGFGGTFDYICKRLHMDEDSLSEALGFKSNKDRIVKLIFEDVSESAYTRRINRYLKSKNIPLRVSCLMIDTRKMRRTFYGLFNKER